MENKEIIKHLKEKTSFDEDVCGCFVSNFRKNHICSATSGGWCKDYIKCKFLEENVTGIINR